jgi:Terminase RNaseH-like domain
VSTKVNRLLAEKVRREAFPRAVDAFLETLFDAQRALVHSPAKRKLSHAGRRSGKTRAFVARGVKAARDFPGQTIPVFERTLTCVAAQTFWSGLIELDTTYKLGLDFHHTYKSATFRNGAVIQIMGADTLEACDKARGGKFPVAFVDEAGTFRSKVLEYLVTEVLEPASIDYDGEILVGGTPNPTMSGWFYESATYGLERGWEVHHSTLLDNPTLGPDELTDPILRRRWREQWLADLRQRYGWTIHTPRYVREYEGRWAVTGDDYVYPFSRALNIVSELPARPADAWTYALSIDLGFNDPSAFVVWGRVDGDPTSYVVESYEQTHLIPSAVAAHVERLRDRYAFRAIVCDTGGYGKAVAEEMRQRFGLPIKAAAKRDKLVYLEFVAGELRAGRIKVLRGANVELIDDLCNLAWNDERTDSSPGSRDHLPDAFLYGEREISSWTAAIGLGDRDPPEPYSAEWWIAEENRMEELLVERARLNTNTEWKGRWAPHFD